MRGGGSASTHDKWHGVNQLLRDNKLGVLCPQETHITDDQLQNINKLFERQLIAFNSPDPQTPNARGVAFVLSKQQVA